MSAKKTKKIDRLCGWFRRRLRLMLWKAGICRMLIIALALLPVFLVLDWWIHLDTPLRLLALVVYLGLIGITCWFTLLKPLRRTWDNKEVLGYLDSVMDPEDGMLLDYYEILRQESIQELESGTGQELADRAADSLEPVVAKAKKAESLQKKNMRKWIRIASVLLITVVAFAVPLQKYAIIGCTRFFNPFSRLRWPHRTSIELAEPENGWTIPQFEDLKVTGNVTGVVPPQVLLAYQGEKTGYWIKEKINVRDDGHIEYTFKEVGEPIEFYIEGGDFRTYDRTIEIINRPYLEKITAHYDYPAYAKIPDKTSQGGQLYGLEGTKVRLEFECSMELKKALFVMEGEEPEELEKKSETRFEKNLVLQKSGRYKIELYEKHGFREARPEEYDVRVIPDAPPVVEILAPGMDLVATGKASVDISFRAEDDFGLKKVAFMYSVENSEPVALTDKITGPIRQKGTPSEASFTWDLRKTELPPQGIINYHVYVEDINPTGRGKVKSRKFRINLVKPSEFHRKAIEDAKRLETEARIAWENQMAAWKLTKQWQKKGTGEEHDKLWVEMNDKQDLAIRASRSMDLFLRDLTEKYTRNNMSREFMSVRLGIIKDHVQHVVKKLHPDVDSAIRDTKPKTAEESVPGRLKTKRNNASSSFIKTQKLALLHLERVLMKLFDWRDLQMTTVRTTLLHEEQGEVLTLTEKIAPLFIGQEKEDIPEKALEDLLTLGKRQQTMFDVETELENQLVHMKFKARKQKRLSIQKPLDVAYKVLRNRSVNDNLKKAAKMIANNQPYQILDNQRAALHALDIVKGGFIVAGKKVTKDKKIVLAMVPNEDLGKIEEVGVKVAKGDQEQPGETDTAEGAGTDTGPLSAKDLLDSLPQGTDILSKAISIAWEVEDNVLARTKYLSQNSSSKEMPRYIQLKQRIIGEYQGSALTAINRAVKEAEEKAKDTVLPAVLKQVANEFSQSHGLIRKKLIGKITQQLQADSMATLKDILQYIALKKVIGEIVSENKRRDGVDAFDRKFLFREQNLDAGESVISHLSQAGILQEDIGRKVSRFLKMTPSSDIIKKIEEHNKKTAQQNIAELKKLVGDAENRLGSLTEDLKEFIAKEKIDEEMKEIAVKDKLNISEDALAAYEKNTELMASIIQKMRTLLEEREKAAVEVAKKDEEEPEQITLEDFKKQRSAEYLTKLLKEDTQLPEEIRNIMLKALKKGFPDKYRDLLAAYYASILQRKENRP